MLFHGAIVGLIITQFFLKLFASLSLTLVVTLSFAATQWIMQPKESQLTFVGTQAGAPFEGKFEKFTADIKFDPKNLATNRLRTN
jgi:polyisoprenoid-binding protein YceI